MFSINMYLPKSLTVGQNLEYIRGHMQISDGTSTFSSEDLSPDNTMALFQSITELLDGVRNFYESKKSKYEFVGSGCRFSFFILKNFKKDTFDITSGEIILKEIDKKAFLETLQESVKKFLKENNIEREDVGIFTDDFYASIADFNQFYRNETGRKVL